MRTTLTLDPEVGARLHEEARRTGRAFKTVVNEALRRGLGIEPRPVSAPPFHVQAHPLGALPGVDLDRMNQLADQLEAATRSRDLGRDSA